MNQPLSINQILKAKLAASKQASNELETNNHTPNPIQLPTSTNNSPTELEDNPEQNLAVQYAREGKSFVLTGPAGSGKTTTMRRIVDTLIQSNQAPPLQRTNHKYLKDGAPGIVIISYTNKAVENVKKRLPKDLHANCITAHKLLEYEPVYVESTDETGKPKKTMRFEPKRTQLNPLPVIHTLIIDEATMMSVELWNLIIRALPKRGEPDLQLILMGDIQQLPPVFGKSIFIHAMQKNIPVVELTKVFRQALESPILALAHRVLSGKVIPAPQVESWSETKLAGKLTIKTWKKSFSGIQAEKYMMLWLPQQIDAGTFNPEEDVILTPFNVNFGTELMNTIIASHYAKKLEAEVYEVFTGTKKCYFRVGERVLHNKSEAVILRIEPNKNYFGKQPRKPSSTMDYKGVEHDRTKVDTIVDIDESDVEDWVNQMMEATSSHVDEGSPAARAASHVIVVQSKDTDEVTYLSTAGEVNNLLLGYAITVHRSQGSEYRRVFFISHSSNAIMIFRELIYTAITRAKEELVIICEPNTFVKGVTTQRIPGKTIQEKIANFDREIKIKANLREDSFTTIPNELHRFIPEN